MTGNASNTMDKAGGSVSRAVKTMLNNIDTLFPDPIIEEHSGHHTIEVIGEIQDVSVRSSFSSVVI